MMNRKVFSTNALSNASTDGAKTECFPYIWMKPSEPQNFLLLNFCYLQYNPLYF